ncbi:UDP-glucose 4-epimerase GalE [Facklamia languida]
MAILVTGGSGYIGSHIVVELLEQGQEVIVVDNLSNSKAEVIDRIETIAGRRPIFYQKDILDQPSMADIFSDHDVQMVIHLAGYKAVGESVVSPLKYYHNNIGGTVSLLEVMNQFDVKHLIFSSSATVYGSDNPVPFNETMPIGTASNPYGYTKLVIEQMLQDLVVADPSWSITSLRYFNPIGAHKSGLLGEDPQGIPNNLMPYLTQVAIGDHPELKVFGDDYDTHDGTGVRDYIHVVDLAIGHVKAIETNLNNTGLAIYNLGTGQGYSVLDLIKAFEEVNQVEVPYRVVDRREGDIAIAYADPSKARKELHWQAERDLLTMCRDAWNWQCQQSSNYN